MSTENSHADNRSSNLDENLRAEKKQKVSKKQQLKEAERIIIKEGVTPAREGDSSMLMELLDKNDVLTKSVATLIECLSAERTYYDLYSKSMVTEPDYATRCKAAVVLIENRVGQPVKRQLILSGNVDSMADVENKLVGSPAMREEFKRMIAAAEEKVKTEKK